MTEKEEIREMMIKKAETFAGQYKWGNEMIRHNFVKTLVMQGETIQAIKERWGANNENEQPESQKYREIVDTVNAHYMGILTDLLSTASPVSEMSD